MSYFSRCYVLDPDAHREALAAAGILTDGDDLPRCDPLDWTWNEDRWHYDPLYHAAVMFTVMFMAAALVPR